MKILLFSDVHWSTTTSIVRQRGKKYSLRLEKLIESMNWLEQLALEKNCEKVICLGDFFDKPTLIDEELTALKEIKWNNLDHYFLVGNHESTLNELSFNSTNALDNPLHHIINKPSFISIGDTKINFLPYIVESNREELISYLDSGRYEKTIIISHNDIQGINYGAFTSKTGFSIKEIEDNCDLFLNGHLHNSDYITQKILNVGSLTAHNFTNDSQRYKYGVWILDTNTLELEFIENPYSLQFYKLTIPDITVLNIYIGMLETKLNVVLSIKCLDRLFDEVKEQLDYINEKHNNLIDYRISAFSENISDIKETTKIQDFSINHLDKFKNFILDKLGNSNDIIAELQEVCK